MRSRTLALALIAAMAGMACRKSDAERAAAERAALQKDLRSSYVLAPYRLLKLAVRAEGAPGAPPELQAVIEQVTRIGELGKKGDVKAGAESVLRLAALAWQVRSLLDHHDEDEFPLLWTRFSGEAPAGWYDAGAEHLALAFVEGVAQITAANTAAKGKDTLLLTFAAYELSRAEPSPAWPAPERLVARLERGVLFAGNHRHYAAEEELGAYLAELDEGPARVLLARVPGQRNPFLLARGVGYLARGWNRLELDREKPALADLDAGLNDLEGAGIENELTLWTWAAVHARRRHPAEAAAKLDRLAESPYLDEAARSEIRGAAASLRGSGKLPGKLLEARGIVLIGRALIARAGGVESIIASLVGPGTAHRVCTPWQQLLALQEQVAEASDPARIAGEAKTRGSRWIEEAKAKVWGTREASGAPGTP